MKNSIGVETTHELMFIVHIVTEEDGSLKIKRFESFFDSNVWSEFMKSIGAAVAAAHANK